MKHAQQVEILKELKSRLDGNIAPDAGKILMSPTSAYKCEKLAQQEWETFFQGHPQIIGFSSELPNSGSFLTLNDFGTPVLATRDNDGKFRAFVNACRHRGSELVSEPRGEQVRFSCPFHAWTYANDGRLLGIRAQDQFGDIDKSRRGLLELPSEEKYGMLFVHPKIDGVLDVDALLGAELAQELETWRLGECSHIGESVLDMALNWKIANDTFGETYHFASNHKETVSNLFHGDVHLYDEYGQHHRMTIANKYLDTLCSMPESNWAAVDGTALLYHLFPNIQLVLFNRVVALIRIYPNPSNVGRSLTRISHYTAQHMAEHVVEEKSTEELTGDTVYQADTNSRMEWNLATQLEIFLSTIEEEDYEVGQKTQITVDSGKIDHLLFGRNEPGLHHFHNNYRNALGMPPLEEFRGD